MANIRTTLLLAAAATTALSTGRAVAESPLAPPITKLEARQWSADVLKRRVLDQLREVLIPIPHPSRHRRPTRPLTDLWFWTIPQSTGVRGLCSSSEVTVYFRPDQGSPKTASAPAHATDLTATRRFRVIAPPRTAEPDYLEETQLNDADEACAALDPLKVSFFSAPDAAAASTTFWLVGWLQKSAESPGLKLDCHFDKASASECRKRLSALNASDIRDVEKCDPPSGAPAGTTCYDIDVGLDLRVYANAKGEPFEVTLADEVVIADERLD